MCPKHTARRSFPNRKEEEAERMEGRRHHQFQTLLSKGDGMTGDTASLFQGFPRSSGKRLFLLPFFFF